MYYIHAEPGYALAEGYFFRYFIIVRTRAVIREIDNSNLVVSKSHVPRSIVAGPVRIAGCYKETTVGQVHTIGLVLACYGALLRTAGNNCC